MKTKDIEHVLEGDKLKEHADCIACAQCGFVCTLVKWSGSALLMFAQFGHLHGVENPLCDGIRTDGIRLSGFDPELQ